MATLAEKIENLRWALNMMRARAWRRDLLFSERAKFDSALRPRMADGSIVAYPDAIYHVKIEDLCRAIAERRR